MKPKYGRIFLCLSFFTLAQFALPAAEAQITLDGSTGAAGALSGPNYEIGADVGTQTGGNLFHSFGEFNINTEESATFTGPDSVSNIVSRVTGGNASRIDGLLRSGIPGADFFLLNPGGVMFGSNAMLDIGGSFHVSTADYLRLGEDGRFDALEIENSVLSTAPPSVFGFLGNEPAGIGVGGQLVTPPGETLSLTGGNVEIAGAMLAAQSGKISIASVASAGEVVTTESGPDISAFEQHGDILISGGSVVNVSGDPAGEIHIRGGNFLVGNPNSTLVAVTQNGGAVDIQVSGDMLIADQGKIFTATAAGGRSGDVSVSATSLYISNGGGLYTQTGGEGEGGNIGLNAGNLEISDGAAVFAETSGRGKAGNISLSTDILSITRGGGAFTQTAGSGPSGDISISAETLMLNEGGKIFTQTGGEGAGGNIDMEADKLEISGAGTSRHSSTSETGDGGEISISGGTVLLDENGMILSRTLGTGQGGNIKLKADHLKIADSGSLFSDNTQMTEEGPVGGTGHVGDIHLEAGDLEISAEGRVYSATGGTGDGGDISLYAGTLTVDDRGTILAETRGSGNGGDVALVTESLNVTGGSVVQTFAKDAGQGGNITVNAKNDVSISGFGEIPGTQQKSLSGLYSNTFGTGGGGNISVSADVINIRDNALISADNGMATPETVIGGEGQGGDIALDARRVDMNRAYVSSSSIRGNGENGDGGNVLITAQEIVSIFGSGADDIGLYGEYYGVYSQTQGTGNGGAVTIRTDDLSISKDATINAQTFGSGSGGQVGLEMNRLNIHEGGSILVGTYGAGHAGDISIDAGESVSISGRGTKFENSWVYTATHSGGHGGNLSISTPSLNVGREGLIFANTMGDNTLDGNTLPDGNAGRIHLDAAHLEMRDGGSVSASTECAGSGGSIEIKTTRLEMSDHASIDARSTDIGNAGNISVDSSDMIRMTDSAITTEAENAGGGRMTINVNNSLHLSDAEITSSVRYGAGNGGDIRIGLPEFFIMNHSKTIARAYEGEGGNIDIAAEHFIQSSDSVVDASSALGIDGIVRIESPDEDVGDALTVLPVSYIDAARWLGKPCRERGGEAVSHFVMQGKDAIPTAFDDWLPSPLPWIGDRSESDE